MEKHEPLVVETTINAPSSKVWKALTTAEDISQWIMPVKEFKPEVGFEFKFIGHDNGKDYPTSCKVVEIIHNKKLSYTWSFDEAPAYSLVTYELTEENGKTKLKLTHEGLENIPAGHPDLSKERHLEGWTMIIKTGIKNLVETGVAYSKEQNN
jgi:uncharacterized protein YndB with AHSA1/START domain